MEKNLVTVNSGQIGNNVIIHNIHICDIFLLRIDEDISKYFDSFSLNLMTHCQRESLVKQK